MMRTWMIAPLGLALALGACGNTQEEEAASGGVGGAAAGALVGGPVGAVVGAGAGAAAGAYGDEAIDAVSSDQATAEGDRDLYPAQDQQQASAQGMTDATIRDAQRTLQDMGLYQGQVDGIVGPKTRAAVSQYQTRQGIEQTGRLDRQTLQSLDQQTR